MCILCRTFDGNFILQQHAISQRTAHCPSQIADRSTFDHPRVIRSLPQLVLFEILWRQRVLLPLASSFVLNITWYQFIHCFCLTFSDAIGENDDGIVELGVLCSDCTVDFGCVFNRRSIRYHENDFVCNSMYLFSTSRKRHNAWVALDSCFDRNFVCFATDTDLHFQIPGVTREGTLAIRVSP